MADVEFGVDGLIVKGVLGQQVVAYRDIQHAVVRREVGLKSPVSDEVLVIVLGLGQEIPMKRARHLNYEAVSAELHELANKINKLATYLPPPNSIPDDVAADVQADLAADDRPWWET